MAAGHAIQRERRTDGGAFIETEAGFSPSPFHLSILQNFMVGGAGARHESALLFPPAPHVIVKPGAGNMPVGVVQARDHFAELLHLIQYSCTEIARGQLVTKPRYLQLR